mmetsp:Transcript_43053/g.101249  ORF Transcript_43053/g.101249 Transcript_43053/m.101249 type:complete len:318 (+) Transcript_43053:328-1281(+)
MPVILAQNLKRKYIAPAGSGAHIFVLLINISMIIAGFLIAYYSGGLWVKEKSYREQPIVNFKRSFATRLQGINSQTREPFEIVYSTLPPMNRAGGDFVRTPIVRVNKEDHNLDLLSDVIRLSLSFPVSEHEGITQVQGVFLFSYVLRDKVRLDIEAPVFLDYAAGVPGSRLTVDGRMRLELMNPLPVRGGVRTLGGESLLPLDTVVSGPELTFSRLLAQASAKNDTTVLTAMRTAWDLAQKGCEPDCEFVLDLTVRVPSEEVLYVPTFIEVCKFSWIQFIATVAFVAIFAIPLKRFVVTQQVVQSIVQDDKPAEKLY